jgi:hypothetical protein
MSLRSRVRGGYGKCGDEWVGGRGGRDEWDGRVSGVEIGQDA